MIIRNKLLLTFFIALIVTMLAGYPFGHHPTDYGFIDSLSYRIFLGQIPYIDFHYVRPPVSLYFHSIPIYVFGSENLLIVSRIFFYLQLALISYIGSLVFIKIKFLDYKHLFYLATISFLLSVHNFPSVSWHTIDGIFFSIFSIYFFISGIKDDRKIFSLIGGLMIMIAALSKQSFYPLPFIFLIAIMFCNFRHALFYLLGLFLGLFIFYLYLSFFGNLSEFLLQTSSTSNAIDAIESIYIGFYMEGIGLSVIIISFTFFNFIKYRYSLNYLDPLLISVGIALLIRSLMSLANISVMKGQYIDLDAGGFNTLLLIFTIVYFFKIFEIKNLNINLITLTFISLISLMIFQMISWGYPKPMLFVLPGLALFLRFHESSSGFNFPIKSSLFVLMCSLIYSINLYRDSPKFLATENLGDLYPRLNGIYVGKENYRSYELLKEIQGELKIETVLPTFTLFNYFTEHETSYPIDWSKEAEMPKNPEYYFESLSGKKVIIQSGCDTRLCELVRGSSKKIKENHLFAVYSID